MNRYQENRAFMQSAQDDSDIVATADIAHGVPQPPLEKPYPPDAYIIPLPPVNQSPAAALSTPTKLTWLSTMWPGLSRACGAVLAVPAKGKTGFSMRC